MLYSLPESLDPSAYEHYLRAAMETFDNLSGYETDKACKDWSRMYRVPFGLRDGKRQGWAINTRGEAPPVFLLPVGTSTPAQTAAEAVAAVFASGKGSFELPDTIDPGKRHDTLMSYAASLRARGLGSGEILDLIVSADKSRCTDPIQDDPERGLGELRSVAEFAASLDIAEKYRTQEPTATDPAALPPPLPVDGVSYYRERPVHWQTPRFIGRSAHVDMADWTLAVQEEDGPKMVYAEGAMWKYHDAKGIWEPLDDSQLQHMARVLNPCMVPGGDGQFIPHPLSDSQCKAVANQMRLARCATSLTKATFPDPTAGLAFVNGLALVTAAGVTLVTHAPGHYARAYVPVPYAAGGTTPIFDQFCKDIWPDDPEELRKETVLRYLGLCLLGQATRSQVAMLWVGEKARNGKSTFLKLIKILFPKGTVTALSRKDLSAKFVAAEIQTALINVAAEVSSAAVVDDERLKAAITNDAVMVQRKNQKPFMMSSRSGLIFALNDVPWMDPSFSILRRFLPIHFNHRIETANVIDQFEDRMTGERTAILAACLDAASRYYAARARKQPGFPLADASVDPVILEADHTYEIFAKLKAADHKAGATISAVYEYYRETGRNTGIRNLLPRKALSKRLAKLGFTSKPLNLPSKLTKSGYTTAIHWDIALPTTGLFAAIGGS